MDTRSNIKKIKKSLTLYALKLTKTQASFGHSECKKDLYIFRQDFNPLHSDRPKL